MTKKRSIFARATNYKTEVSANEECEDDAAHKKQDTKKRKAMFSTKNIATMGIMAALAFVVQFLEIPLFPAAPFLKLDFSNVFVMLVGFLLGPVEAVIVLVVKELLHIPVGSTGGVGELANILTGISFVILPATVYRFKKGLKVVIPCLIVATCLMTAIALPINRFINYPFFMGAKAGEWFEKTWQFLIYFNLIKGASICVICCVIYKTLSRIWRKI